MSSSFPGLLLAVSRACYYLLCPVTGAGNITIPPDPVTHIDPLYPGDFRILSPTAFNSTNTNLRLHFFLLYAILTLLISAVFLLLYLHRLKASHFRLVPHRNTYPTMNVTIGRMTESLMTERPGRKEVLCMADEPPV